MESDEGIITNGEVGTINAGWEFHKEEERRVLHSSKKVLYNKIGYVKVKIRNENQENNNWLWKMNFNKLIQQFNFWIQNKKGKTEEGEGGKIEYTFQKREGHQLEDVELYYDEIFEMNKDEIRIQSVVKVYAEIAAPNYFMPVWYFTKVIIISIIVILLIIISY